MTIEECKNQVVISYEMRGFKGNLITDYSRFTAIYGKGEDLINDIVKLYASQFKSEISLLQEQLRLSEENNKVLLEKLKGQWISVKDRLPDSNEDVLCLFPKYNGKGHIQFVGCYTKGHEIEYSDDDYQGDYDEFEDKHGALFLKARWYECEETPGGDYDEIWLPRPVTHWQPLPTPSI
jgi:hypothetical protein